MDLEMSKALEESNLYYLKENFKHEILLEKQNTYDISFNVLLIGDSSVGKTNIITQGISNEFNESYKETYEFNIYTYNIKLNNKIIDLQIYDTSGNSIYKNLILDFSKDASLIILVYSIDNKHSFDNIKNWLDEIKIINNEVEYVIIGNKNDLNDRKVTIQEGLNFAKENNCILFSECSAKNYEKVSEIFINVSKILYDNFINEKKENFFINLSESINLNINDNVNNNNINSDIPNKDFEIPNQDFDTPNPDFIYLNKEREKNKKKIEKIKYNFDYDSKDDYPININGKEFNVNLSYHLQIISILIEEKKNDNPKIYEKSFNKKDFENISDYFKTFDNNIEIYEKMSEFFKNNLFNYDIKEYEFIISMKNVIIEFVIEIPLKKKKEFIEYIQNLFIFAKAVKDENDELKEKIQKMEKDYSKKIQELKDKIKLLEESD